MAQERGDQAAAAVLYVDPDEAASGPVVDVLSSRGFVVEQVPTAERALERLAVATFDCLITEQALPGDSGLALLREVRETSDSLPVILFTDSGDEQLASEAIAAGVSDYVPRSGGEKQRLALVDALERVIADGAKFPTVDEALKDQAMDEAPIGITIAHASRRDLPLIYTNEAFRELSGYDEAESLGRNCNFLQGPDSDPDKIEAMARSLGAGEPITVEIRNYTKAGEEFWNQLHIAPVRDDGELTHFVGFQLDVTERITAEREAKRQAERARAERETVEALLARLDGLVTDVTSDLLAAETRDGIETTVCERLVAADEYAAAWIGEPAPTGETVAPRTWAGSDPPAEFEASLDDGPVARALATGEIQVVTDETDDSRVMLDDYEAVVGAPVGAVAAIPLRYGDVDYGVLVVALAAGAALTDPERRVLTAIGQLTAIGLHALTSQRLLVSDDVIELEFALSGTEPAVVGLAGALDASVVHLGTVARDDGPTTLFFETDADAGDELTAVLASLADDVTVTTVTTGDERTVLEVTMDTAPVIDLLRDRGGRVTDMRADGRVGELTIEIPPEAQPRAVVDAIEDRLPGAELTAYREDERPADTRQDVRARIDDRLTDRQETALRTAIVGGFFEWPRQTTGEDLAETMDIGRSTYHQHLRAAQRKVFEELYPSG